MKVKRHDDHFPVFMIHFASITQTHNKHNAHFLSRPPRIFSWSSAFIMGGYKKSKKKSLGQALFAFLLFTTRDHLVEISEIPTGNIITCSIVCGYLSYCTTYYVFMWT